jgi:hypothetical protein
VAYLKVFVVQRIKPHECATVKWLKALLWPIEIGGDVAEVSPCQTVHGNPLKP